MTTVTAGRSSLAVISGRVASCRATALVVVPPLKPTTVPGATSPAAATAICCLARSCEAVLYRAGRS